MTAIVTGNRCAPFSERGHDCYETPAIAVHALMRVEKLPEKIWEPCCGPGSIVRVLREAGHTVAAQDLIDYGCPDSRSGVDFLTVTAAPDGIDTIFTNPPYMHANEFVAKALELVPRVIMLLRLGFIESECRKDILDSGRLARFYPFIQRLPMMHRHGWDGPKNEAGAIGFAWYCWEGRRRGDPTVKRIGFSKCRICKGPFVARTDAVTCSPACRQQAYRNRTRKGRKRVTDSARGGGLSVTKSVTDSPPDGGLPVTFP